MKPVSYTHLHPGFNIPMEEGLSFEDYELEFSRACEPQRILFSQECFVEGKESYELLELSLIHIYPAAGNDYESLYLAADNAMYASKKSGKNRIYVDNGQQKKE